MWIKNCWYVIAWEHEVPPAESADIFLRKVLNEPIVVYRTQAGKLVALKTAVVIAMRRFQRVAAKVIVFAAAIMVLSSMNKDFAQKFQV